MVVNIMKSLAPGFLLATPELVDKNFERTVILLFQHGTDGALGLVLNREGEHELAEVLAGTEFVMDDPELGDLTVFVGGPVSLDSGWVVFEGDDPFDESFEIEGGLRVTGSKKVLQFLLSLRGVQRFAFFLGYAGWGAGQLDAEMDEGSWFPAPIDRRLIFETPITNRWRTAFLAQGVDPALWSLSRVLHNDGQIEN